MGRLLGIGSAVVLGLVVLLMLGVGSDIETDGPVVRHESGWLPVGGSGSDAIVGGELSYDDGCLLLDGHPVVWPDGTSWDEDGERVELRDGVVVAVGDTVRGGGGMGAAGQEAIGEAVRGCPGADEVVVFNADSDLVVE